MKYLTQFIYILGFSLIGEALQRMIPLPIPTAVYGIVLLFAALCLKIIKVEQVKEVGSFLSSILPVLFVSPAVGILDRWDAVRLALVPICLLVGLSTVLVFGISGKLAQLLMGKKEGNTHAE